MASRVPAQRGARPAPRRCALPDAGSVAELVPDPARVGGWTLLVDGVEQSYVDIARPGHLEHAYMRYLAAFVDTAARAGAPLRVLHLGGGALTLARYLAATRPGSTQRVVERHAALDAFVRDALPLPAGSDIRTVHAGAREAVEAMEARFDVIVTDVYDGARMPASVASVEFARHVARLLAPAGVCLVNVTDLPPGLFTRIQAATLRAVFDEVCAVGEPGMLRGRKYGNVVLAAARSFAPERLARVAQIVARERVRVRLLPPAEVDSLIGAVGPMSEVD